MSTVTIHEAKTNLSRLIAKALDGEDIVIARDKTPVVRLTPVDAIRERRFGALKGVISMDEHFNDPLPDYELEGWGET